VGALALLEVMRLKNSVTLVMGEAMMAAFSLRLQA
jgi:hypothetical protein